MVDAKLLREINICDHYWKFNKHTENVLGKCRAAKYVQDFLARIYEICFFNSGCRA